MYKVIGGKNVFYPYKSAIGATFVQVPFDNNILLFRVNSQTPAEFRSTPNAHLQLPARAHPLGARGSRVDARGRTSSSSDIIPAVSQHTALPRFPAEIFCYSTGP